jgi:predicted AAA+ superfamily ATPase
MESIGRFLNPPERSFFLFGPRGTGKSTWTQENLPDALRVDLLEPDTLRRFSARPERLLELVHGSHGNKSIVIDEVQKVPALLPAVHALIEEKKGWRFVLTGSSARKLKRAGVDLLAGRALLRRLYPFMAAELGERFDLARALRFGMLPLLHGEADPAAVLSSYAALYLREEVQYEGLTRAIGDFARFLEAASFSHASVLNVSNVARECEVERKVVQSYFGILEDLMLAHSLPVFTKRARRELASHGKFYFFDAGVLRTLRPAGPLDRPGEIEGQALEGLVAQHLMAWSGYSSRPAGIYFWRTRSGVEVDFVVYGEAGLWAIEVKNTAHVRPADLTGLRAFREDYPTARSFLLYRGRERLDREGILCLPVEEFLLQLRPDRRLDAGL